MKKTKPIAPWVALGITLLIMGLIFYFSSQPGPASSGLSNKVANTVQHHATTALATPSLFSKNFHANVRKWAHVYLYGALGFSVTVTVNLFFRTRCPAGRHLAAKGALLSAAICTLYSASDEFHQSFVPGRTALITDIGVDSLGFLSGVVAASAVLMLLLYFRGKKSSGNGSTP